MIFRAAGVTVFELACVMGTSVRMIEKHYARYSMAPKPELQDASTLSKPSLSRRPRAAP